MFAYEDPSDAYFSDECQKIKWIKLLTTRVSPTISLLKYDNLESTDIHLQKQDTSELEC